MLTTCFFPAHRQVAVTGSDTVGPVLEPVRTVDRLAGGVVSTFGAGLFLGLAPAASLAGWWLVVGMVLAAALAVLFALSTPEQAPAAPLVGIPARLAVAVAVAGTFGRYVLPDRPQVAAVGLVVVVAALVLLAPPLPLFVARVAAVVVLAVLVVVAVACFTITPVSLAVTPPADSPGTDDPLGLLPAAALLYVCFAGAPSGGRRSRFGVVAAVLAVCLAVGVGALRQLGGERLALSRVPLLDALAAADATSLSLLLALGVTVGCAFALRGALGDVRDLAPAGRPANFVVGLAAGLTALGAVLLDPVHALVGAAVLLLGEAGFRMLAGRRDRA